MNCPLCKQQMFPFHNSESLLHILRCNIYNIEHDPDFKNEEWYFFTPESKIEYFSFEDYKKIIKLRALL